tara:strand:+ start:29 stop:238 length:210 start_codon:yes stop_codon:yes gene_type:complete
MKEKKYWLTESQIRFLEKFMKKIDDGWHLYSYNTRCGIEDILDYGYYKDNQKDWLKSMRLDYMDCFIKK